MTGLLVLICGEIFHNTGIYVLVYICICICICCLVLNLIKVKKEDDNKCWLSI